MLRIFSSCSIPFGNKLKALQSLDALSGMMKTTGNTLIAEKGLNNITRL